MLFDERVKLNMKTRQSLMKGCKNEKRKIVVKFYFWEKLCLLTAGEIFLGRENKKGGGKARRKIKVLTP